MTVAERKIVVRAQHDGGASRICTREFEDGSLLDLLAYEEEQAAIAEAEVRERFARCAVEVQQ